ncbi:MAG: type II secretion system protein GspG [Desulfobulbaceae bacterium]|nr:MAG: type II secretion system protein GspG [Desulfobulbaceae bacterium]
MKTNDPHKSGRTESVDSKFVNPIFRCSGFTLLELLVVVVILSILAGYIGPRILGRPDEARQAKAEVQIGLLETALGLYRLDNSMYPTTEQGLAALASKPTTGKIPEKWRKGGYLVKGKVPKDPWGNPFIYKSPGVHGSYDLSSLGGDGRPGGEGVDADINNWELE